jgi:hypothetical protein
MELCVNNCDNRQLSSSWFPEPASHSPFLGKKWFKSSVRAVFLSLMFGGLMAGTTYAHDPVLNGSLTIDFQANQDEISRTSLASELKIRIPNQRHVAGIRIPRTIEGQPFRGQEFSVSLVPNGCMLDGGPDHGQAILRLTQKLRREPLKATVFKAHVFGGQYECLFGGASQALPFDPFDGNHQASVVGELLIWWAQVLSNQNPSNALSVEEEMHRFFDISDSHNVDRLRLWGVEYPSVRSKGCSAESKHVHCSRGGSADGVFSTNVRARFEEQENPELQ